MNKKISQKSDNVQTKTRSNFNLDQNYPSTQLGHVDHFLKSSNNHHPNPKEKGLGEKNTCLRNPFSWKHFRSLSFPVKTYYSVKTSVSIITSSTLKWTIRYHAHYPTWVNKLMPQNWVWLRNIKKQIGRFHTIGTKGTNINKRYQKVINTRLECTKRATV